MFTFCFMPLSRRGAVGCAPSRCSITTNIGGLYNRKRVACSRLCMFYFYRKQLAVTYALHEFSILVPFYVDNMGITITQGYKPGRYYRIIGHRPGFSMPPDVFKRLSEFELFDSR